MLRFSDSRNFARTLAGLSLLIGPLFLVLGSALSVEGEEDTAKYLENVADKSEGVFLLSGICFLLAGYILIPGLLGVIRLFRGRRITFGQIAAALVLVGVVTTIAFYPITVAEIEQTDPAANRAEMVAFSERIEDNAGAIVLFAIVLLGIVLGNILLAIAAWRKRVIPVWAAGALAIAPILGFFSESILVGTIAFVILWVGLGALGLRILSTSDEEWDRPAPAERPEAPPLPGTST